MKKKILLLSILSLAVIALSSCGCNNPNTNTPDVPKTSDTTNTDKYLMYNLKSGADKSKLYGSPWLDLSRNGVVKMIEKPDLKEDFYGNINYDILSSLEIDENTPIVGGMGGAINDVTKNLNKILKEETSSSFSNSVRKIYSTYNNADKTADKAYVKSLIDDVDGFSTLVILVVLL